MAFCREKNQKLLFKVDSLLNFRKWFMYGLKAQKLIAQGVLLVSFSPGLRASAPSGRAACVHCLGLRASASSGRVGKSLRNLNLFLKKMYP